MGRSCRWILLAAAHLSPVGAQSKEPAENPTWDAQTGNCSTTTPTNAKLKDVTQTAYNKVSVAYENYNTEPLRLWMTDQDGTVIAYTDDDTAITTPYTFTFTATEMSAQPTYVRVYSCPPSSVAIAPVRMWRDLYDDVTNNCCSDLPYSEEDVDNYMPRVIFDWANQRFSFSIVKNPKRLWAQDSVGRILHWADKEADPTGTYVSGNIDIPPFVTSVRACSSNTPYDSADQKNPLCTNDTDLVDFIIADIESHASNPGTPVTTDVTASIAVDNLTVSYGGTTAKPVAFYQRDFGDAGENCVTYAKDGTTSGPILGLAFNSKLQVSLTETMFSAETTANPSNRLYIYSCCGVTITAGTGYVCPFSSLYAYGFKLADEITAAQAAVAGTTQGGLSTLSASGQKCDNGLYSAGDWYVNATAPGQVENCTCTAPDPGEIFSYWKCKPVHGKKNTLWRDGAIVAVVLVSVLAVLILIGGVGYMYMQAHPPEGQVRASRFGTVKFPPATTTTTETYT